MKELSSYTGGHWTDNEGIQTRFQSVCIRICKFLDFYLPVKKGRQYISGLTYGSFSHSILTSIAALICHASALLCLSCHASSLVCHAFPAMIGIKPYSLRPWSIIMSRFVLDCWEPLSSSTTSYLHWIGRDSNLWHIIPQIKALTITPSRR